VNGALESVNETWNGICAVLSKNISEIDAAEEYAIPQFSTKTELAECQSTPLKSLMEQYSDLFRLMPGKTNETNHCIPTTGNPSKVPPRRIPARYQ